MRVSSSSSLTKRCRDRCIPIVKCMLQPARAVSAVVTSKRDIRLRAKLHGTTGNRGSANRHEPARPAADGAASPWDGRHELSHVIRTANRGWGLPRRIRSPKIEQLDQLIPIQCHRSSPYHIHSQSIGAQHRGEQVQCNDITLEASRRVTRSRCGDVTASAAITRPLARVKT